MCRKIQAYTCKYGLCSQNLAMKIEGFPERKCCNLQMLHCCCQRVSLGIQKEQAYALNEVFFLSGAGMHRVLKGTPLG